MTRIESFFVYRETEEKQSQQATGETERAPARLAGKQELLHDREHRP